MRMAGLRLGGEHVINENRDSSSSGGLEPATKYMEVVGEELPHGLEEEIYQGPGDIQVEELAWSNGLNRSSSFLRQRTSRKIEDDQVARDLKSYRMVMYEEGIDQG